jgi:predicted acyl esterase
MVLSPDTVMREGTVTYEALGNGVTFWLPKCEKEMEITGPLAAKLFVSSSTRDADLFLILRVFDPAGKELTFMGSTDPNTPIANGWLRVSHRRLVPEKTFPYRPYHPHDRVEPLIPGEVYECDVEYDSTCIVVRLAGRWPDGPGQGLRYEGELGEFAKKFHLLPAGPEG